MKLKIPDRRDIDIVDGGLTTNELAEKYNIKPSNISARGKLIYKMIGIELKKEFCLKKIRREVKHHPKWTYLKGMSINMECVLGFEEINARAKRQKKEVSAYMKDKKR